MILSLLHFISVRLKKKEKNYKMQDSPFDFPDNHQAVIQTDVRTDVAVCKVTILRQKITYLYPY